MEFLNNRQNLLLQSVDQINVTEDELKAESEMIRSHDTSETLPNQPRYLTMSYALCFCIAVHTNP